MHHEISTQICGETKSLLHNASAIFLTVFQTHNLRFS